MPKSTNRVKFVSSNPLGTKRRFRPLNKKRSKTPMKMHAKRKALMARICRENPGAVFV